MNKNEITAAVKLAQSKPDFSLVDDTHLHGCALPGFPKTYTTLAPVAKMISHLCLQLNGTFDNTELDGICTIAKKKFILVGE